MTGRARDGKSVTACFQFPPEFIGFQGHFPQKKILPGVCQIQLVISALEKDFGRALSLKEVVVAKYFSPVLPDEEITCVISDAGEGTSESIVKAVISKKETKIAELKLRITPAGERK